MFSLLPFSFIGAFCTRRGPGEDRFSPGPESHRPTEVYGVTGGKAPY